jgi:hypothetical protein
MRLCTKPTTEFVILVQSEESKGVGIFTVPTAEAWAKTPSREKHLGAGVGNVGGEGGTVVTAVHGPTSSEPGGLNFDPSKLSSRCAIARSQTERISLICCC